MKRVLKILFLVSAILIIVILTFVLANRKAFGEWNPFKTPQRVICFERTYILSSLKAIILEGEKEPQYRVPHRFLVFLTGKKFYMNFSKGEFVPTVIYLHLKGNEYYVYELSGGP